MKIICTLISLVFLVSCKYTQSRNDPIPERDSTSTPQLRQDGLALIDEIDSLQLRERKGPKDTALKEVKITIKNPHAGFEQVCLNAFGASDAQRLEYQICPNNLPTCDASKIETKGFFYNTSQASDPTIASQYCLGYLRSGFWKASLRACLQSNSGSGPEKNTCGPWVSQSFKIGKNSNKHAEEIYSSITSNEREIYQVGLRVHSILNAFVDRTRKHISTSRKKISDRETKHLDFLNNQVILGSALNGHFFLSSTIEDLENPLESLNDLGFSLTDAAITVPNEIISEPDPLDSNSQKTLAEKSSEGTIDAEDMPKNEDDNRTVAKSVVNLKVESAFYRCLHEEYRKRFEFGYQETFVYSLQKTGIDYSTAIEILNKDLGPKGAEAYITQLAPRYRDLVPGVKEQLAKEKFRNSLILHHLERKGKLSTAEIKENLTLITVGGKKDLVGLLSEADIHPTNISTVINLRNANTDIIHSNCDRESQKSNDQIELSKSRQLLLLGQIGTAVGAAGYYATQLIDNYKRLRYDGSGRFLGFLKALTLDQNFREAGVSTDAAINRERGGRGLARGAAPTWTETKPKWIGTSYTISAAILIAGLATLGSGVLLEAYGLSGDVMNRPEQEMDGEFKRLIRLKHEQLALEKAISRI